MSKAQINRFEWLKAVMQSAELNATAKALASAMAVQFANEQTGQLNPAVDTLADYLKTSKDSIKRAVKALVDGGWLGRTEGRGRGNRTVYRLVSPGKIVAFRSAKRVAEPAPEKGATPHLQAKEKGADLRGKGGNAAPSYIEQSLEQNGAALEPWHHHQFSGKSYTGLTLIRESDHPKMSEWGRWLKAEGFPPLSLFPIREEGGRKSGPLVRLPWDEPPKTEAQRREARAFFASLLDTEGARHAAQ